MRGRRSQGTQVTSMELLLDTMCNTFGGIVLIAILVALLSQNAGPKLPDIIAEKETSDMLQRRIASVENEIAKALEALENIKTQPQSQSSILLTKRKELEDLLESLKQETQDAAAEATSEARKSSVDLGAEFAALKQKISEAEAKILVLENSIKTQNENSSRLKKRLDSIASQIEKVKAERVTILRFPKERTKTKSQLQMILRYRKVFLFQSDPSGNRHPSIKWISHGSYDTHTLVESKALGSVDLHRQLRSYLENFPTSQFQVSFYIYPDSFDTFTTLKKLAVDMGYDYGWDMLQPDETYTWGSTGTSPPPL